VIRAATIADLDALMELEVRAFATDRFSRSQWRHLLTRARGTVLVDRPGGGTARAAAAVLFRRGSRVAHLYSIAVHPGYRGRGIARRLLRACHRLAAQRGSAAMRLEVRERNAAARALYEDEGYRLTGQIPSYYADHAAAVRYEKPL